MPNTSGKPVTRPEGNGGISSTAPVQGGGTKASSEELAKAVAVLQQENERLHRELNASSGSNDNMSALVAMLAGALKKPEPAAVDANTENINRTSDFKNQKMTVDGRSMVEAQQVMQTFRNEEKLPISISKSMANFVGTSLTITVNGVRVSIPCDGRTYMINRTHWEHAKERLAKIDILNSNTEDRTVVIDA